MSSDHPVPATLEHILAGVRAQLDVELRAYTEQVVRSAAEERDRAIEQASRLAAEERDRAIEQASRTAAEERDRAVQQATADIRRQADDELEQARRSAETQFHELQRAREAAEATISELQRERAAAEARVHELHQSADVRVADLAADRDRLRAELATVQRQLQELERRELEKREQEERAAATRTRSHVAPAIRALDESESLGQVLDRLAESAVVHGDRAVVLTLKNDRLRPWRAAGVDQAELDLAEMNTADAGIAGMAARESRVVTHAGDAALLPSFAASSDVSEACAFPVTVGGAVVAVLYADVADERGPDSTWIADVEVLCRHASRVLEAITMQQAMGLRAVRVARPSQAGSSAATTGGPGGASTSRGVL